MNVTLNAWHDQQHCTWCEKQRECVSVTFDDGFLKSAPLCWGCLQKAVRVRSRQQDSRQPSHNDFEVHTRNGRLKSRRTGSCTQSILSDVPSSISKMWSSYFFPPIAMNAITLRNRWLTTYRQMHSTVHGPQPTLPLGKPALWKRMLAAGWVLYRAADHRRGHSTPGIAFDLMVVALLLVLVVANIVG